MLVFRSLLNFTALEIWLLERKWTPESIIEWQEFYNNASRFLYFGGAGNFSYEIIPGIPPYKDLTPPPCHKGIPPTTLSGNSLQMEPTDLKKVQKQKLQVHNRLRKT